MRILAATGIDWVLIALVSAQAIIAALGERDVSAAEDLARATDEILDVAVIAPSSSRRAWASRTVA